MKEIIKNLRLKLLVLGIKFGRNPISKAIKCGNLCLDEWHDTYSNLEQPRLKHNRVLPKLASLGMIALLIFTLVVVI